MNQPALFHESINDALRELVAALGGTKAVGARMRPEMSADLQRQYIESARAMARLAERIERVNTPRAVA